MVQPFRSGQDYCSSVWPGLMISYRDDHLLVKGTGQLECISSAVYNGGLRMADHWVNWRVPLSYQCSDPVSDVLEQLGHWEYPADTTIGLITAAKLTHAAIAEQHGDHFRIVCCSTSGTRNAARAGLARPVFSAYPAVGTINTMVFVDGRMSHSAMVNALITAAEAKAAALSDLGIQDLVTGSIATGTTTDALMIGVSQSENFQEIHRYAGAATTIGNIIGKVVYDSVYMATVTQHES
ncbi:adenosylcobinamide amidohydrolase [Paenibacillus abyssi]|uniref:Adenosylcobinamide amidohydrolase n=1 Tax=Paenibacillus abyssi TaxID=1340531 RepID=A0A917D7H6_9BACL|nr:adenosylcobinamide amidohydrolase [Paenibacillus abyssi]GGG11605.1 hypothetical protein GCM10010916_30540 [Paenibacillus abyssi]